MPDIQWDSEASLMRVTSFATAEPQEALVARGTVRELVGRVLEMPPQEQEGLLLRASGPDRTEEHDADAIRELAARPEYTSALGAFDTAALGDDPDRTYEDEMPIVQGGVAAPDPTDARGRDGDR